LGILFETEDITPDAFICPSSDDTSAHGPTTQAVVADLTSGGHLSYIYLGKKLTKATATANTVVVYEPLSDHHDYMNVLFGDGHVECITMAAAKQFLQKVAARQFPMTMPTRLLIGC
jgi:prepilin-type processing-associated H-X9-DG protein